MAHVVVVGAGVLGTMHAWMARRRGHTVTHLDADTEPRGASVRNFGLVWVSGRAPGDELALALRARELWDEVSLEVPAVGLRPDGSLTVAQAPEEVEVLRSVAARPDAEVRGVRVLETEQARRVNPAVRGPMLAALHCVRDAIVEPGRVLPAVRKVLGEAEGYTFVGGRTVHAVDGRGATDHTGARHGGDAVLVCPGAAHDGIAAEMLAGAPLRRCRLQMMQTEPLGERLTTALADGDSLRYYPAFAVPERDRLPPPPPVVRDHHLQLLVAQRASGALTIGDTHAYEEPFDFALEDAPYAYLATRVASILGRPLPPIVRRWAGVYSQATDDRACVRVRHDQGVVTVTGPGGRGMTLAPALAEQTFEMLELA